MRTKIDLRLKTCLFVSAIAICGLSTTSQANEASIPMFALSYTLENDYITAGEADIRLSKKEDHYQFLLETKPTGMFRLSKKGKIREIAELPSLQPPFLSSRYTYTNFGDEDRSYTSMFNRTTGEATVIRNAQTSRIAIDTNTVDRLSMTLALMSQLHQHPNVQSFDIDTMDSGGKQTFSFVSKGQEMLDTKLGRLAATRVDRQRVNSNRNTVTWLATVDPNAPPVPVLIEQYRRGKLTVRLKIDKFSLLR